MKRRDAGFSLIELIVVMAMIAVLTLSAAAGIGMATGFKLKQSVKKLESGLDETKVNAMSREACILEISKGPDGSYYMEMSGGQKEKLADSRMSVSYIREDTGAEYPVEEGKPLCLSYQRSSGAFLPIIEAYHVDTSADAGWRYTYTFQTAGSSGSYVYCSGIVIRMGSTREATLRLAKDTGRHYLE